MSLSVAAIEARAACPAFIEVPDRQLPVRWLADFSPAECSRLASWLRSAARATSRLYGVFPCRGCEVEVKRHFGSGGPVPWAHVSRGEPTVIKFNVNPEHSLEDFLADWTAVHEFSHLFIPFPGNRDIWFAEGLATYYQNVLRARAGLLAHETAWRKLREGFERGRADDDYRHLTLQQLSPRMWSTGSYMRVYWSGVAYFFNLDIELRRRSDGRQSLDTVLSAFNRCCLHRRSRWSASTLARQFDELSDSSLFTTALQTTVDAHTIPDVAASWQWLGIRFESDRPVLSADPAERHRRQAVLDP